MKKKNRFISVLFARKSVIFCTVVLVVMILASIFAPFITPYDPVKMDLANQFLPMSLKHIFGTDSLGQDVMTRLIYGGRISFAVGAVSVVIAGILGMMVGLIAGITGGFVDTVIMRVCDAMMSIPMIVLALFLGQVIGKGLFNICLAIGICMLPGYARLTRGQVLTVKSQDYVVAGMLCGASKFKNAILHILPNCISMNIVMMTMSLGGAILCEASLSFLGMGLNPTTPTWGTMVNDGYNKLSTNPVLAIIPGVCIMVVVLCFSIIGDAARDALDPKLRGTIQKARKKKSLFARKNDTSPKPEATEEKG